MSHDQFRLITCPTCNGKRQIRVPRGEGREATRACRECKGSAGKVLQGMPPDHRYGLILDYTR